MLAAQSKARIAEKAAKAAARPRAIAKETIRGIPAVVKRAVKKVGSRLKKPLQWEAREYRKRFKTRKQLRESREPYYGTLRRVKKKKKKK